MASDDPDVIREKMWVTRPKGTHLSHSTKTTGHHSPLTRTDDTNALDGHVTLSRIEEDEDQFFPSYVEPYDPEAEQLRRERELHDAEVVGALIASVVVTVAPHVERLLMDRLAAFKAWGQTKAQRKRDRAQKRSKKAYEAAPGIERATVEPDQSLVAAAQQYRRNMSSSEAQARYLLALAARRFSDEQFQLISQANIVEDEALGELEHVLAGLPSDQVLGLIEQVELNPHVILDSLPHLRVLDQPEQRRLEQQPAPTERS